MEYITNLGTDGLVAGALLLFAIFGFIKRLVKLFFLIIELAIGAVAGLWGYNNGYSLAKVVVEKPEDWMVMGVAVVAFIGAFCLARTVLGLFTGGSKEGGGSNKLGSGIPGSLLSLLVGGGIAYAALTAVRYAGSMSELERVKEYADGTLDRTKAEPLFAKLKTWVDESRIGQWHQRIDFLNDPAQTAMAKLAIITEKKVDISDVAPDEVLKAIPVKDSLQSSIREGDFSAVLKNDQLRDVTTDAEAREALMRLNIEKALGLRD
ncbi:hypothetical protein N9105_00025 [Akkermansiaceae bacterium]|nr:hypothetical protein [Akkermansiaceae bacterium]MDB4545831.1 hypothetical protein [Akkermansiaceae bacterium]MDB4577679.1 hypothetical protein [Akkermansiaceae bacterium]